MAGMKLSTKMFMIVMFMVASMHMQSSMAQTRHVVGDALGWTIPTGSAYTTWASQQTFVVGDTLFFNFTTDVHDVAEVSQAAYGPCTTTNPISITTTGPATVTLTAPGTHYYICTFGTHCQIGQKLAINVSAAPTTPPPASTPTTPPTPTPTPTPTPVSPPTTTRSPAPAPSTTTPPPTSSQTPSPVGASPPSPTTSSPSPSDRTTPSTPSDTTPPPSTSTAARSFIAVVPATFLAIALAFFY
ncbi:blue copper protein 1a-like [Bidens hawaiensis]|uniref:blue copper protein 1a-like n=1 Tax=Bidens hawaiensis TaxID=980011 RepID=UPI00404B1ABE